MYQYRIYPDKQLIIIKRSGKATLDDYIESYEAISRDPDFSPDYHGLVDARDVQMPTNMVRVRSDAKYLSRAFVRITGSRGRWVNLVRTPLQKALTRFFSGVIDEMPNGVSLEVLSDVNEASEYLGIDVSFAVGEVH